MQVIKSACRQTLDIVEFLLSKYYKKAMIELGLLNEDLKANGQLTSAISYYKKFGFFIQKVRKYLKYIIFEIFPQTKFD